MAYDLGDNEAVNLYAEADLRSFSEAVLLSLGATQEEAQIVTDGIVTASLWFHPGQGQGRAAGGRFRATRTGRLNHWSESANPGARQLDPAVLPVDVEGHFIRTGIDPTR